MKFLMVVVLMEISGVVDEGIRSRKSHRKTFSDDPE
jgi:hypothetical protein